MTNCFTADNAEWMKKMDEEEAVALVVNGFCKDVLQALPMEFAMEAQQLVAISLEGSVG
jgi:Fe-S cluster assembly protein SufB